MRLDRHYVETFNFCRVFGNGFIGLQLCSEPGNADFDAYLNTIHDCNRERNGDSYSFANCFANSYGDLYANR